MQPLGCINFTTEPLHMNSDVFQAIADPTRRAILGYLASGPRNVNAISGQFPVSRMAVYKHIKLLTASGLIEVRQRGRERFCEVRPERLAEVSEWIDQLREPWIARPNQSDIALQEAKSIRSNRKNKA